MHKRRHTVLYFAYRTGVSVAGMMCQLEGRVTPMSDKTVVRSLQFEDSIFGAGQNTFISTRKRRHTVLCVAHRREGMWIV